MAIQNCKTCGNEISRLLVEAQDNPESTEWVKGGYCSHSCFEKGEGSASPDVPAPVKAAKPDPRPTESVTREIIKDCPESMERGPLVAGWILAWLTGFIGLIISIHIMRAKEYYPEINKRCPRYKKSSRIQAIFMCVHSSVATTYLVIIIALLATGNYY
jgi:hypothetical protein